MVFGYLLMLPRIVAGCCLILAGVLALACSGSNDEEPAPTSPSASPTLAASPPTQAPTLPTATGTPQAPTTPTPGPPGGAIIGATPTTNYGPLSALQAGTPVVYPPVTLPNAARASWTPQPRRSQGQVAGPGAIEGALSYPSEGLPPSLVVCAESIEYGETYCTAERPTINDPTRGDLVPGYQMLLPPGRYYVYAEAPLFPLRAYYSLFVPCGLHVTCPSHDPIIVTVRSGQLLRGVDPQDWYALQP